MIYVQYLKLERNRFIMGTFVSTACVINNKECVVGMAVVVMDGGGGGGVFCYIHLLVMHYGDNVFNKTPHILCTHFFSIKTIY